MTEKNFIDFILDTENDEKLLADFLKYKTSRGLYNFFQGNGYAIDMEDCEKLITAKVQFGIEDGVIPPAY